MNDELRMMALTVVADDYESFAIIMSDLEKWIKEISAESVIDTLAELVANEDVKAYYMSATPPHCTEAPFELKEIDSLWFYITLKGLEQLKRMEAETVRTIT